MARMDKLDKIEYLTKARWAMRGTNLPEVLNLIVPSADDDGLVEVNMRDLSIGIGLSRNAAANRVRHLVEAGWLRELVAGQGRKSVYELVIPEEPEESDESEEPVKPDETDTLMRAAAMTGSGADLSDDLLRSLLRRVDRLEDEVASLRKRVEDR